MEHARHSPMPPGDGRIGVLDLDVRSRDENRGGMHLQSTWGGRHEELSLIDSSLE